MHGTTALFDIKSNLIQRLYSYSIVETKMLTSCKVVKCGSIEHIHPVYFVTKITIILFALERKIGYRFRYMFSLSKDTTMKMVCVLLLLTFAGFGTEYTSGKSIEYRVGDKTFEGYYITPQKDAPLVILIHDWDGVTDYEIKRAHMLAKLGYAVFAIDLFGKGVRPTEVADKRKLTGELYKNRKRMQSYMLGAIEVIKKKNAAVSNAVVMGYCFGGTATLELARTGIAMKGFVSFHGGLQTPEGQSYAESKGKLLVIHGSADASVSLDDFASLAKELEAHTIKHEMITYSGAPHAFTVFGSERYREDADRLSWDRLTSFLKEVL